jgi:hypothetical protein
MTTKDQLTEQKRGKGGTIVRYNGLVDPALQRDTYVVKDLMTRKSYDRPDRVGIGPADIGVAFGVSLADLTVVD